VPKAKRRKKTGGWGGRRDGAGRQPDLPTLDREDIARDYFMRMDARRVKKLPSKPPDREAVIQELMGVYGVPHRIVVRCLAEFLPEKRRQHKGYLLEQKRKHKKKRAGEKKI
jgi:hypothetical protein